jgi:hypothetical protein
MEGAVSALFLFLLATGVAVFLARITAIAKHRGPVAWMWAVALFPPALLALALVPRKNPGLEGARS